MKKIILGLLFITQILLGSNFENILASSLQYEGNTYVVHTATGEKSKYGITEKTLRHWNRVNGTDWKVKDLTLEQVTEIYEELYWEKTRVNEIINKDLARNVFDFTIHSGQYFATVVLQRVINDRIYILRSYGFDLKYLDEDGIMGSKTLAMANLLYSNTLINNYKSARISFVRKDVNYSLYKNGWLRRINTI